MTTPTRYELSDDGLRPATNGGWVRWEDYCETVRKLVEGEPEVIPPGFRALSDVIAETEKDPERKARLDSAREQLRRHGLVERIRQAQVEAGEQVVDEWMRDKGLT